MAIEVNLDDHTGKISHRARMDENAVIAQLIPAVISSLRLPITDNAGRPMTYHLSHNNHRLQEDQTLTTANVQPGDTLRIVPEMVAGYAAYSTVQVELKDVNGASHQAELQSSSPVIQVELEDVVNGEAHQVKMNADVEIAQLIPAIISSLRLPITDNAGRSMTYHLSHNNRHLQEHQTLAAAEVQPGDTLTIVPEMVVGGPESLSIPNLATPAIVVPPSFTLHDTLQHTGAINQIAWSPDGRTLASTEGRAIRLWQGTYYLTLQGHSSGVNSIAWSPNGDVVASDFDRSVRLWDTHTGQMLQNFRHYDSVNAIAWSPTGDMLASGSSDNLIRIWNTHTQQRLQILRGHAGSINSVAWSPMGDMLASSSSDSTIRIWDIHTWQTVQLYEISKDSVASVAWAPNGKTLVSSSLGSSICIWDISSGKLKQTLEVHTQGVSCLSFSADGRFLASLTTTGTVQIWRSDVWDVVATLNEGSSSGSAMSIAFHPKDLTLATPDQTHHAIKIWDLDISLLLKPLITTSIHYANAKVVLLGDSGVGKSGLGLVLTGKAFVPTESTHGRHVWLFDSTEVNVQDEHTETHEILLWDLAGQPGYRLIHQLHLNEVAIALVVFDARSQTDPFAGVQYWNRALRQVQQMQGSSTVSIKKFLVAARTDREGISVSQERLARLVQEWGFDGYFETSAKNGKNIPTLIERIKQEIDWSALPRVSSTSLFQQIKAFLLAEKVTGRVLSSVDDLYRAFLSSDKAPVATEELSMQFENCIGRVEAQGLLQRLSFGNLILLQPELLDAYASALINAVKDEPDGVGSIAEEKAKAGGFAVSADYRLKDKKQENLLLIAMIEDLLRHEIALREQGYREPAYLIFPSEATRENPDLPDPEGKTVVFNFEGPVVNIYAVLAVRLSRSDVFKKKDLWKNAITYSANMGGTCGLFLSSSDEGRGELTLFFEEAVSEKTRFDFEVFIQAHLQRWAVPNSIKRKRIYVCPNPECATLFSDKQVVARRQRGFASIRCNVCDTEVSLLDQEERFAVAPASAIETMDAAANSKRDSAAAQSTLEGKKETKDFDVFLCHHGIDKAKVKEIGERLEKRGLLPWLDEWHLQPGLPWQTELEKQIGQIKSAAVFVGENGIGPWQQMELDAFLREFVRRRCPVIPLLLEDAPVEPKLPIFLQGMTWVDFRKQDPDPMEQLIWGITSVARSRH